MSRKKSVKRKMKMENTEPKLLTPPVKSKREQLANMLFNDFMIKSLKIDHSFENENLSIATYTFGSFATPEDAKEIDIDRDAVVCYEVISKSNPNVMLFIDDTDISVTLDNKKVNLTDGELAFLCSNYIGYVKKYYTANAA